MSVILNQKAVGSGPTEIFAAQTLSKMSHLILLSIDAKNTCMSAKQDVNAECPFV